MKDVILNLQKKGLWRKRSIVVISPEDEEGLSVPLKNLPEDLWSVNSGYAYGDVDVLGTADALRDSMGEQIQSLIQRVYSRRDNGRFRLVMSASRDLHSDLLRFPWELLETTDRSIALSGEMLSVVRVFDYSAALPEPLLAGERIKIGITWANPLQDIQGIPEHLEKLLSIGSNYSRQLSLVGPIEFTSVEAVRQALLDARPHVFYHIGHAVQDAGRMVELLIGSANQEKRSDAQQLVSLLEHIGRPRLLVLNSCATAIGYEMNPYLGIALSASAQIDAVIAMQTEIPVSSATSFAKELFLAMAGGAGLIEAVKRGRIAIQDDEGYRPDSKPSFRPFIPVLFQRTLQDKLFNVDLTERELGHVLDLLRLKTQQIALYLGRAHDEKIRALLKEQAPERRVSVIYGVKESGKSTSIRTIVRELLTKEQYETGVRCLYYEANAANTPEGGPEQRIYYLLLSLAGYFPHTSTLQSQLTREKTRPENAMARLSGWLREEERNNSRYCIIIDNVPVDIAPALARNFANILTGGKLVLITDDFVVDPNDPINVVEIALMTAEEIRAARAKDGRDVNGDEVDAIMDFSNGFPYFVAGYRGANGGDPVTPDDRAKRFLKSYETELSGDDLDALTFVALCQAPVPKQMLEDLFSDEAVHRLTNDYLLIKTEGESYEIPEALRKHLLNSTTADLAALHQEAFNRFMEMVDENEAAQGDIKYKLVTEWLRESLEHALSMAEIIAPERTGDEFSVLKAAREVATTLHRRYLNFGNEIGAATAMWEKYRSVAYSLGQFDDRIADVQYADCLMYTGDYERASNILEQVTAGDDEDKTQLFALQLYSDLLKNKGVSGALSKRIKLLQKALETARKLEAGASDPAEFKQQIAGIYHALGNALSYGKDAQPAVGLEYLETAQKIYEEQGSALQFQSVSEQIEVKRYNNMLVDEAREQAIETLKKNLRSLVTRSTREQAILHLYELGRLETDPAIQAQWFQKAFASAGQSYQPTNWHAAIQWRICEVQAGTEKFEVVAQELEGYVAKLEPWQTKAWSRRKRRDTLLFLVEGYNQTGNKEAALQAARKCSEVVHLIQKIGEGRKDPAKRHQAARWYGQLALNHGLLDEAREVAGTVAGDFGVDPAAVDSMSGDEVQDFFTTKLVVEEL